MLDTKPLVVIGFVAGLVIGTGFSWWVGSLRVESVQQDFTEYRQNQKEAYQRALDTARMQQEDASKEFQLKEGQLQDEIKKNVVLQRLVTAGRLHVNTARTCDGSVQASLGIDETRTDPVPASSGFTEESVSQVVNDCSVTTLMLNQLQADIENQLKPLEH